MQIRDMQHIPKIGATSGAEHQGVKSYVCVILCLFKSVPMPSARLCHTECKTCKDVRPVIRSLCFRMVPSPKSSFHFQETH